MNMEYLSDFFLFFLQIWNIRDVSVVRCTISFSIYANEAVAASTKAMTTMEKQFLEMKNRDPLSSGTHILVCLPSAASRLFGRFVIIKFFC
jgi:hypothetical protein